MVFFWLVVLFVCLEKSYFSVLNRKHRSGSHGKRGIELSLGLSPVAEDSFCFPSPPGLCSPLHPWCVGRACLGFPQLLVKSVYYQNSPLDKTRPLSFGCQQRWLRLGLNF